MRTGELSGLAFACLEGCGFCCTFPPEVTRRELASLRSKLAPRPVPVMVGGDRNFLQLQNKCGACTLLERRGCQAYDARPQHCRYFPFHMHFADEVEVYVNYTCRGVERRAGGDLSAAFQSAVLDVAIRDDVARHEELATSAYAGFRRKARRADAWGDVDAEIAAMREAGPRALDLAFVLDKMRALDVVADVEEMHAQAMAPFSERDVTKRPFYLAPDLRWITFAQETPDALAVLSMDETGRLDPVGRIEGVAAHAPLADATREALTPYVQHLLARRLFAGTVYGFVDESGYEVTVAQAAWIRLAEIVSDLAARVRVLDRLGTPGDRLADEAARFYDAAFLDAPTIGGWL